MLEHIQGRLPGKGFIQEIIPSSLSDPEGQWILRSNPKKTQRCPCCPPRAPAQCWVPADVHASLDQVQIVSFCQKALGWLLVSPTVLTPKIFIMLSSTYREGKKSSQYLSLSFLPAHPTGAVPPSGTSTVSSSPQHLPAPTDGRAAPRLEEGASVRPGHS